MVLGGAVEQARAAGLTVAKETLVMVARLAELHGGELDGALWSLEPSVDWLEVSPLEVDHAAELTSAPAHYVTAPGRAVGRVALWNGWAVLTSIKVAPELRGRGLGRAVTRALVRRAADLGATVVALQVEEDNAVARRLYEAEGFVEHHRYGYASRDSGPGSGEGKTGRGLRAVDVRHHVAVEEGVEAGDCGRDE